MERIYCNIKKYCSILKEMVFTDYFVIHFRDFILNLTRGKTYEEKIVEKVNDVFLNTNYVYWNNTCNEI